MIIVLEGPNRAGKTTQAHLLAARLREACPRMTVRSLADPGVHPQHPAYALRPLAREAAWNHDWTRLLIYQAARCELFAELEAPGGESRITILDRYIPSYYVYGRLQGRKVSDLAEILRICGAVEPDLTFILRPSSALTSQRDPQCPKNDSVYESVTEHHKRVEELYADLAARPENYPHLGLCLVDVGPEEAGASVAEVHEIIWDSLMARGSFPGKEGPDGA